MKTNLNYFIAWCKSQIKPIDSMDEYEQARQCLIMDEYYPQTIGDIVSIILTNLNDFVAEKKIVCTLFRFLPDIQKSMRIHDVDYLHGAFWTVRDYFRYEINGEDLDLASLDDEVLAEHGFRRSEIIK